MRKLSDYKGEEAFELWADLIDPISVIITDKEFAKITRSGKPKIELAKYIMRAHPEEATEILTRIDPTPLDGINILLRLVTILADIGKSDEIKSFFGYAEQANEDEESSGSPTVTTEAEK